MGDTGDYRRAPGAEKDDPLGGSYGRARRDLSSRSLTNTIADITADVAASVAEPVATDVVNV